MRVACDQLREMRQASTAGHGSPQGPGQGSLRPSVSSLGDLGFLHRHQQTTQDAPNAVHGRHDHADFS